VIYFTSDQEGYRTLYAKAADGSGEARAIAPQDTVSIATDVSPDGAWMLGMEQNAATGWDVLAFSLPDGKTRLPLVATPAAEAQGRLSPDGKNVAYVSNESGAVQVYVQPFPGPGGKWQVSIDGGMDPHWRGDGWELYYIHHNILYAVAIDPGPPLRAGAPTRLSMVKLDPAYATPTRYAVSADGTRFLINGPPTSADVAPFTVVLDWTAGLPR
jgi:eukaryotic-like serine/threonine-protein kinase